MSEEIKKIAAEPSFVIDTTVLFYLQRVGLLDMFVSEFEVIIPGSVKYESLRKDCKGDSRKIAQLIRKGQIKVAENLNLFPGEKAVFKLAEEMGLPIITDDGELVSKLISLEREFTSSPMVPVMLYIRNKLSLDLTRDKVDEILSIGYFGDDVKLYMKRVIELITGGQSV